MKRSVFIIFILIFGRGLFAQVNIDNCVPKPDVYNNKTVCERPDSGPEFPGGLSGLYLYLIQNVKLSNCEPTVGSSQFTFIIDESGQVQNVCNVNIALPSANDREMKTVLAKCPKWTPAKKDGKPVCVRHRLAIAVTPK